LPRFFGITKTFSPDLAVPDPEDPDEPDEPDEPLDELEEGLLEDEQAATARADATTSVEAANGARLSKARMLGVLSWHG
jgi:hypothetical protein